MLEAISSVTLVVCNGEETEVTRLDERGDSLLLLRSQT